MKKKSVSRNLSQDDALKDWKTTACRERVSLAIGAFNSATSVTAKHAACREILVAGAEEAGFPPDVVKVIGESLDLYHETWVLGIV